MDAEIKRLSDAIIGEIFLALGFSKYGWAYQRFGGLFRKHADNLSTISVTADRKIATDGFPLASTWMLSNFCDRVSSHGSATIPKDGPLLVISNHAGTYDTFLLTSEIGRKDLKLIASDVPFLKNLPNASEHLIFLSDDPRDRMVSARAGIRHLKEGGSLLLYGTGLIDPDPSVYPGAEKWIEKWLRSIELFLRTIPETRVVISIVSGVVSKRWAHHPITWLKRIDWQKRRLAEFGQVLQQLIKPGSFYLSPRVSFSEPVTVQDLSQERPPGHILEAVIARGKSQLKDHCRLFGDCILQES